MTYTVETVADGRAYPVLQVRVLTDDGYSRYTLNPADDLTGQPDIVKAAAAAAFTDSAKAAYAKVAAASFGPPPAENVQAEMTRRLKALAAGYTPEERETWATQVKEAEAIKAGATTAAMLAPLAAVKGRTLNEQADRVLLLAAQFAGASGAIMAARDALLAMDPIPVDCANEIYWP